MPQNQIIVFMLIFSPTPSPPLFPSFSSCIKLLFGKMFVLPKEKYSQNGKREIEKEGERERWGEGRGGEERERLALSSHLIILFIIYLRDIKNQTDTCEAKVNEIQSLVSRNSILATSLWPILLHENAWYLPAFVLILWLSFCLLI